MKVYLVGMPGSGKTTLGKQLAAELSMKFVDLDVEIEKQEKKSIPAIFSQSGEDYFRRVESQLLQQWSLSAGDFIMATGGGAPCFHKGMDVINKAGLSIFIDVPVAVIMERLKFKTDRPLLNDDLSDREEKLLMIANVRRSCYSKAKIHLESPDLDQLMVAVHFKK